MRIETSRFGVIEAAPEELIEFSRGIVGFPHDKQYVLIPHATSSIVAWLQSAKTPSLAFPVVSAHGLVEEYPDVDLAPLARRADLGERFDDLAILAVLSAPRNQPATVNLMAPIVVNAHTRQGAQIFLEGSRYSTRELFVIPPRPDENGGDKPLEARVG